MAKLDLPLFWQKNLPTCCICQQVITSLELIDHIPQAKKLKRKNSKNYGKENVGNTLYLATHFSSIQSRD
jgi:hypothetical protein